MWELGHKKAEHWRIDAFELWCWRRLLRVPWTARRSNQSIRKEISPEYSLEGLMVKLNLPILWPPDVKNRLVGKDPDAENIWRREEKGTIEDEMIGWHHRLDGHGLEQALGVGDGHGNLLCYSPGVAKSRTQLSDWTELNLGSNSTVHFQPINLANCNVVPSVNTPPACVKHPVSLDPENTILSEFYVSLSGGHKMVSCC